MKKLFKSKKNKNNKGMTLVEVIIAMTIFVIMVDMLMSAVIVTLNTNKDTLLTNEYVNAQVNAFSSFNKNKVEPTAFEANISGSNPVSHYEVSLRLKDPANGTAKKGSDSDWAIFDNIKCKSYSVKINSSTDSAALTDNADIKHGYFDNATYGNDKLDDFANTFSLNFIQPEEFTPWLSTASGYWYSWVRVHNKVDIGGSGTNVDVKLSCKEPISKYNETYFFTKGKLKGGDGTTCTRTIYENSSDGIGWKFSNAGDAEKTLTIEVTNAADPLHPFASVDISTDDINNAVASNDGFIDICVYYDAGVYQVALGSEIP